jgi:hypothetical protein
VTKITLIHIIQLKMEREPDQIYQATHVMIIAESEALLTASQIKIYTTALSYVKKPRLPARTEIPSSRIWGHNLQDRHFARNTPTATHHHTTSMFVQYPEE